MQGVAETLATSGGMAANIFIIVCIALYFGTSLVSVFVGNKRLFSAEYKLRNCTTVF